MSVFKNKSKEKLKNNSLSITLKGTGKNPNGIGSRIEVYQKGQIKVLQQMPNRGFQSSCDLKMVMGLGENAMIDSLKVIWPDDKMQI